MWEEEKEKESELATGDEGKMKTGEETARRFASGSVASVLPEYKASRRGIER